MPIQKFIRLWSNATISKKCFLLAHYSCVPLLLFLVIAQVFNMGFPVWAGIPTLIFLFFGSAISIAPKLFSIAASTGGRILLVLIQALMVPISLGVAGRFVAEALALPPSSFNVTVALVTVLLIPVGWAFLFTLSVAMTAAFVLLVSIIGTTTSGLTDMLTPLIGGRTPINTPDQRRRWISKDFFSALGDHAFGALVSVLLCAALISGYSTVFLNAQAIRLAAYFLDFNAAPLYPGIVKGRPMRLLDNGFVAYATRDGMHIKIDVAKGDESNTANCK